MRAMVIINSISSYLDYIRFPPKATGLDNHISWDHLMGGFGDDW